MNIISDGMSAISFERTFSRPVGVVFDAFSKQEEKAKWFIGPAGAEERERLVDCRTGGREVLEIRWPSGTITRFEARYHRVEPGARLVYSYDLFIDGALYSVSLADVRFRQEGSGTVVGFTEATSYFSDQDLGELTASRMHGTEAQFDMIAMALAGEPVKSTIDDCH